MRLEFHGGAGTVTGSHMVLDTGDARIGIDAGLFQGPPSLEEQNRQGFGHAAGSLDALLLTHAHIDHSGRVPVLYKAGFRGPTFATAATADLCDLMLRDSARLMAEEASYHNGHPDRRERDGSPPPLFSEEDVGDAMRNFRPVVYGAPVGLAGAKAVFRDAGHILGSATLELETARGRLVLSGDLGRPGAPILRDPEKIDGADYLVLESTYGDREHADKADRGLRLADTVRRTLGRGGNLVIPAFAVGRTQELIYELNQYAEKGLLRGVQCFVDSPMAISATEIYRHHPECFDAETYAYLQGGDDPLEFPGLRYTRTREESKKINELGDPHIVISASGMCTGGRVLHHLARNLERPESTILFAGYQAEGTLGRLIRDGAQKVRIMGRELEVRASIEVLDSFSAHADRSELLEWLGNFKRFPRKVFLNHGEGPSSQALAREIREKYGADAVVAAPGASYELD